MNFKSNFKHPCFIDRISKNLGLILLLGTIGGCATGGKDMMRAGVSCVAEPSPENKELPLEAFKNADDLLTVDCLLPGQLVQIGMHHQWMTPPRPTVTTAWACKVQGGQYALSSDKDGRETALKAWQDCANQGDKVAQNYMGEIYGRSWRDVKPDYELAAEWYRKSAEQSYNRAQNNLGFLYEHGLGVEKNKQLALDLYRQAMGVAEPIKLDQSIKNEINELESKLEHALQTTKTLNRQLSEREAIARKQQAEIKQLKQLAVVAADQQAQLEKAQKRLQETRQRKKELKKQLFDAEQKSSGYQSQLAKTENRVALEKIPIIGEHYALIIGINNYQSPLAKLKTPVNDAKRVEKVLREKYGFKTTLLVDDGRHTKPNRENIIGALIKLKTQIKSDDNLVIYFAGHGEFMAGSGYWLPKDADSSNHSAWISTDTITREIQYTTKGNGGLKARHVLVVADSCYGAAMAMSWLAPSSDQVVASLPTGLITRSAHAAPVVLNQAEPPQFPQSNGEPAESRISFIKKQFGSPSRLLLSSGGLEPVMDQEHKNGLSVFANAFTQALETNEEIINAATLYEHRIKQQVFEQVRAMGKEQSPVYRRIPNAGDNNGDFFFVPR